MPETTPTLFKEARFGDLLGGMNYFLIDDMLLFYDIETETYLIADVSPTVRYTAEMYMQLPEGAPFELINNKLIFMPASVFPHQEISHNLTLALGPYIKKHRLGKMVSAPMDVHFDEKTVVQPDKIFVSIKRSSIIQRWIFGAPDFIVEILSTNEKHDRETKMKIYEENNVIEYWIVHPTDEYIEVYHNHNLKMQLAQTARRGDQIESIAIEGFVLEVDAVFAD